jgi:phosphohistidine phosphatase
MTARTLVLLRHAKAESPAGVPDDQRSLSPRGHLDARAAGAWLARRHLPDQVLCSPSRRTRQTWQAVASVLPAAGEQATPEVRYEAGLYEGDAADALAMLRAVDDTVLVVLVIGHNPGLSRLAFDLDPDAGLDSDGLRTCGLTVHEVAGSWRGCGPGRARVVASHTARGA